MAVYSCAKGCSLLKQLSSTLINIISNTDQLQIGLLLFVSFIKIHIKWVHCFIKGGLYCDDGGGRFHAQHPFARNILSMSRVVDYSTIKQSLIEFCLPWAICGCLNKCRLKQFSRIHIYQTVSFHPFPLAIARVVFLSRKKIYATFLFSKIKWKTWETYNLISACLNR